MAGSGPQDRCPSLGFRTTVQGSIRANQFVCCCHFRPSNQRRHCCFESTCIFLLPLSQSMNTPSPRTQTACGGANLFSILNSCERTAEPKAEQCEASVVRVLISLLGRGCKKEQFASTNRKCFLWIRISQTEGSSSTPQSRSLSGISCVGKRSSNRSCAGHHNHKEHEI